MARNNKFKYDNIKLMKELLKNPKNMLKNHQKLLNQVIPGT